MNQNIQANVSKYKQLFPQVKQLLVKPSNKKDKRLVATFILDGDIHTVHFGQKGAFTYADGATIKKRDSYRARASKITNADNQYTYNIPGTANSLSYYLLW